VLIEIGPIEIAVPRDTMSTFEPQIIRKRQQRLTGINETVLSLMTPGSRSQTDSRPGSR
jgi:putative transposase